MRTIILSLALFGIAVTAQAAERLVLWPVETAPNASIASNIKRDCGVDGTVSKEIFQRVSDRFPGAEQVQGPSGADSDTLVLKVTILAVSGFGGGSWSGPKSMAIQTDILRNGTVAASHMLSRSSRGGAFGGMSGTCAIMDRIAVALGRDVEAWLPGALTSVRTTATAQPTVSEKPGVEAIDQPTPNR